MHTRKLLYWSLIVGLAGFLFGFDTVVISGADQALQALWPRGEVFHGFVVMGAALWGTVVGAIFGGLPTDKLGRKNTLIWIGVLYTISALGSALASDPYVFAVMRFIGGLGVGASTIAAPAYIAEIAPAEHRGKLVALYQFNIVFGILIAFVSNFALSGIETDAWRYMVGIEAVPAVVYALLVLTIPKSPRWLLSQGRTAEAQKVLALSHTESEMEVYPSSASAKTSHGGGLLDPRFRRPLMLAFFIAFFNQFSGINALLYYAPRIFAEAGLGTQTALLSSIGIGVVNLVFTLTGLLLIDRVGRKTLMYIGSVGYIISLGMVTVAFTLGWQGLAVPGFLFLFIAAHAIGQGTVIWVFISEIFPTHLRASGQAFGSSVHWVLAAIIPSFVPVLFLTVGAATVFGLFAVMMVLQLLFVWRYMPETKGVELG